MSMLPVLLRRFVPYDWIVFGKKAYFFLDTSLAFVLES